MTIEQKSSEPHQAQADPGNAAIHDALAALMDEQPSLGQKKLWQLLCKRHPDWKVGQARAERLVKEIRAERVPAASGSASNGSNGASSGTVEGGEGQTAETGHIYPSWELNKALDLRDMLGAEGSVKVQTFTKTKGKGLVATRRIKEGEVVWREEPWVLAARGLEPGSDPSESSLLKLQDSGAACTHCGAWTPGEPGKNLAPCPSQKRALFESNVKPCRARFCKGGRCLEYVKGPHRLLCIADNPACAPLLELVRKENKMALHTVARSTAKLIFADKGGGSKGKEKDMAVWNGLAALDAKVQEQYKAQSVESSGHQLDFGQDSTESAPESEWTEMYKLYIQTFKKPPSAAQRTKLADVLKKGIPSEVEFLFEYDQFLISLGKMNLNMEGQCGLYELHSHLNHHCRPNLKVKHPDMHRFAYISVVAERDIQPGEELSISYVAPGMSLEARRRELRKWGFGECRCSACVKEAKKRREEERNNTEGAGGAVEEVVEDDMPTPKAGNQKLNADEFASMFGVDAIEL
ncbi:SET domain-containing protein [Coniophora puteana RWD-64-598 SS2]|uniref:Histone-lysine N-methyltransferase SET5 n=1 Tax=Coniophora puteana (strain RWD-64-598) TaxID=741705 RepID=A0A5M3MCF3_CONPW|nr:SET domain-containing protein [Coniophora puteana RWD-64-598 SS2]EIW76584.1 SET domain-containing protein [Coniophora puteana RWD-64-598 SS2]